MSNTRHTSVAAEYGSIEVQPWPANGGNVNEQLVQHSQSIERYIWTPAHRLQETLSTDFRIELGCAVGSDGIRRFFPADGWKPFVHLAWFGGLAILADLKNLSPEELSSHRFMRATSKRRDRPCAGRS